MHKLKRMAAALLACLLLAGCAESASSYSNSEDYLADIGDHSGYVDTLTPGIDYYGYINGKDLINLTLDDKHSSVGTIDEVADLVDDQLKTIIEDIAASKEAFPRGSDEQMIHDMYHLVMDSYDDRLDTDAEDTALIDSIMEQIRSVQDVSSLKQLWRDLTLNYGVDAFLVNEISINSYNTKESIMVFSFRAPADLEDIKDSDSGAVAARDTLEESLEIAGIPSDDATKRATDIIYAMYEIAGHTDFDIINKNKGEEDYFHVLQTSAMSDILHNLTVEDLLYSTGYSGQTPEKIVVYDPELLTAIDSLVDEEHLQVWKDIAVCLVLNTYSDWLPEKYRFTRRSSVSGERMARYMIKSTMESELGELYTERYYNETKRKTIRRMCDDMKTEYGHLIEDADWISGEGKTYLKEKLDKMTFFIGADKPHEIDPASADVLDTSVLKTLIRMNAESVRQEFELYTKVPDRNGFSFMAPCTLNACYIPQYNCINITAAITNDPLYDEKADYYANLGRIGTVIGHEISHAFDSSGVKYDAYGNLRPDAMPEADIKAFEARQLAAVKYYDKFKVLGSHVNGRLTLAENFADISGLQCALAIAATPEKQKTLLENYAFSWKTLSTDTDAKMLLDCDVHSPAVVRCNAVVACFDEFYEIYGVKEGDPMYVAPEKRVRRW